MKVLETLHYPSTAEGLRELANVLESQYQGAKVTYISGYGNNMDVNIEMPPGTTIVLPRLVDARGEVEE